MNLKTHKNKKSNFLLYTVERSDTPFIYYHMIKNINQIITFPSIYLNKISDATRFMNKHFNDYIYKGNLFWNDENYIFYEIVDSIDLTPTYSVDSWWKVTPYELLYTQRVLMYPVDKYYSSFFKQNPEILFLIDGATKYETPIVGYLGVDESELNQQFLLHDINYKKGYYFGTIEQAYFQSLFTSQPDVLQLENPMKTIIKQKKIHIKDNQFYLGPYLIGNVPSGCNSTYVLHDIDSDFIYLKKDKECYTKRSQPGCIIRYVLFLKKTSISPTLKRSHDSFTYGKCEPYWFPTYMVKKSDQFVPLSYHYSADGHLDESYLYQKDKDKDTLIRIK
jgi:hypothetical protein